jgi:hypothetical protein
MDKKILVAFLEAKGYIHKQNCEQNYEQLCDTVLLDKRTNRIFYIYKSGLVEVGYADGTSVYQSYQINDLCLLLGEGLLLRIEV